jgi:protein O-GlcNAc transferase
MIPALDEANILDTIKLDKALRLAKQKSKNGQLEEAKNIYEDILQKFPKNKKAMIALQSLVGQATLAPQDPPPEQLQPIINLYNQGQLQQALSESKKLLDRYPNSAYLFDIAGTCNASLLQFDAAIDSYKQALKIRPDSAEIYNNMSIALERKGDSGAAIKSSKQALKIKPDFAEAYNNLGNAQEGEGKLEAAMESYKKALKIKPDYADALYNIGNALKNKGSLEAAIGSYQRVLKIKPDYVEAHNNMGFALSVKGDLDAALDSYQQAINLKPDYADAYYNRGNTLAKRGELEAGIKSYGMALKINPTHQSARAEKLHQQSHICDWARIEQDRHLISKLGISTESISPFSLQSLEDAPERHQARSEVFNKKLYGYIRPLPLAGRPSQKPKRLRIGYFSADFHEHAVAYLMAKVIETHDRTSFEIYGYSIGPPQDDDMRQRLVKGFDVFDDVRDMSNQDIALLAQQDKIDIAIDLTGHTQNGRSAIFAYRAAPVQINYLGYPGTMGAVFMDYIIADPVLIPCGYEQHYNESILRLPNTYMPTDNTRPMSTRPMSRSEMGLPEDGFVFCCFNNNYKISPREFDIWMRVLVKIDDSVLWLRNSNALSEDNLRTQAEARGVNSSRLVFAGRAPMDEHLARQKLADLFLDTFDFNAHTTAAEALWTGLPVVTKVGKGFAARVAASLLTAVGLPELITETEQEYEELILHFANNPERLAQTREKLVDNRLSAPLFDTALYTTHLEDGYQQVYQRYYDGKLPKDVFVTENCSPEA